MDIVLNSLAGELTDASLRLLPRGGAFVEMGKTDVRDPAQVARDHPGVGLPGRSTWPRRARTGSGEILARGDGAAGGRGAGRAAGAGWDVRRAPEAFRFMSQARHTGKLVLTIPPDPAAPRRAGTVLVTGGTGTLGGLVARHLAGHRAGRAAGAGQPVGPGRARAAARWPRTWPRPAPGCR